MTAITKIRAIPPMTPPIMAPIGVGDLAAELVSSFADSSPGNPGALVTMGGGVGVGADEGSVVESGALVLSSLSSLVDGSLEEGVDGVGSGVVTTGEGVLGGGVEAGGGKFWGACTGASAPS